MENLIKIKIKIKFEALATNLLINFLSLDDCTM